MIYTGEPTELDRIPTMEALAEVVKGCQRCGLRAGCTQVVFGEGVWPAGLMCIGEGPGADEDRLGRPFVGRAGQLLDRILEVSGFDRKRNCYIANIVKCRPPGNPRPSRRNGRPAGPICGRRSGWSGPKSSCSWAPRRCRGSSTRAPASPRPRPWIEREGIHFMPTYHPAALLRDPSKKKDVWNDMKQVIARYRELVDPNHYSPYA